MLFALGDRQPSLLDPDCFVADSAQVTVPDRAEPVALAGLVEQLEESVRRA